MEDYEREQLKAWLAGKEADMGIVIDAVQSLLDERETGPCPNNCQWSQPY